MNGLIWIVSAIVIRKNVLTANSKEPLPHGYNCGEDCVGLKFWNFGILEFAGVAS